MEKVYSNTSKVVVDVEGGNNMMYLPLDKIMQQNNVAPRVLPQSIPNVSTQTRTKPSVSSGRSDRFSSGRN